MFLTSNKRYSDASDQDLVQQYKQSFDQRVVAVLFERYMHLVFGVCLKYLKNEADAKDFTMEIFEQLLVKLQEHEVSYFKGWLHMVAKNHCLMHLRKQQSHLKRHNHYEADVKGLVENDDEVHPFEDDESFEIGEEHLADALDQLKDEQRVCVELFYLQNMSYQDVSDKTGYTMKQVKSFIQNGKRNLRIYLENKHGR